MKREEGVSLRATISSPAGKGRYVRRLFSTIADRYDLVTVALSYGQDRRWKARLIRMAGIRPGHRVLDLACGTGDLAFGAAREGARVVGLDITVRMIELARMKEAAAAPSAHQPRFLVGDMLRLPFPDAAFDVVTTGYGVRNVPYVEEALSEVARVLRPEGRMLSLDFDRPPGPFVWACYYSYLTIVGSLLGWCLHGDPDTYRYIPESIRTYVGSAGVSRLLRDRGFADLSVTPLLGGLMAINVGVKRGAGGMPPVVQGDGSR